MRGRPLVYYCSNIPWRGWEETSWQVCQSWGQVDGLAQTLLVVVQHLAPPCTVTSLALTKYLQQPSLAACWFAHHDFHFATSHCEWVAKVTANNSWEPYSLVVKAPATRPLPAGIVMSLGVLPPLVIDVNRFSVLLTESQITYSQKLHCSSC